MDSPKLHLLIVDDEPLNRELLRRLLSRNYELSEAGDAAEAIEVLDESHATVQLILCDYLMPGKTGAELAAIVHQRWPDIPFMLLTGCDGDEEVLLAQAQGLVKEVVSKPWRSSELRAAIATQLENAPRASRA